MALVWCRDVSPADWLTAAGTEAWQLIGFGPAGFAGYARLRFLPDPIGEGQRATDLAEDEVPESQTALMRDALGVLALHTATPDDCYFCLWDGWGSAIRGGDGLRHLDNSTGVVKRGPLMAPAFDQSVLDGPKVSIPYRDYHLFRGALTDFGDWGAADYLPGMPRTDMPAPAFVWPADRSWCLANDVDPHWAGIGAGTAAIDELLRTTRLDITPADPTQRPPAYR